VARPHRDEDPQLAQVAPQGVDPGRPFGDPARAGRRWRVVRTCGETALTGTGRISWLR
jgi:hypothetical protein